MNELTLSGLISSRICHDLISPVGAIGNGMELLNLSAEGRGGEELALIADCADAAAEALQFLRIAFGARDGAESVAVSTLASISTAYFARRRIEPDWAAGGADMTLGAGRTLLLLALVGASALPRGGAMTLEAAEEAPLSLRWRIEGDRMALPSRVAGLIADKPAAETLTPGEVHILLLWLVAEAEGVRPFWREDGDAAAVGVG